jgi:serine protease Do
MVRNMVTGSAPLTRELEAIAEVLRLATVQVQQRDSGGGSGIIWRSSGLIITNAHVVRGPSATVKLSDGRVFDATVTSRDPEHDIAALRVQATNLPYLFAGDSSTLQVGELVFAVGNPRGVARALTIGIVHALGPRNAALRPKWIQADLSLPRGYSGGPLADARGHVIGVNSMIYRGLALAVPSNTVASFLSRRRQRLAVYRSWKTQD